MHLTPNKVNPLFIHHTLYSIYAPLNANRTRYYLTHYAQLINTHHKFTFVLQAIKFKQSKWISWRKFGRTSKNTTSFLISISSEGHPHRLRQRCHGARHVKYARFVGANMRPTFNLLIVSHITHSPLTTDCNVVDFLVLITNESVCIYILSSFVCLHFFTFYIWHDRTETNRKNQGECWPEVNARVQVSILSIQDFG